MTTQKKTTIGGQAIIEGIVMKGPKKSCTVVRRANGELVSKIEPTPSRAPIWEKPIFRGAYTLFTAMKEGMQAINYSASFFEDEEADVPPSRFELWLEKKFGFEGCVRVVLFLLFMWSVSHMKDIRRTFEYHGAEHKTIFCYEAGEELTVENVRKQGKYHPRCGTSFMFVLIIIATIVSSIVFSIIDITNPFLRMLAHLILLPLVVGISYEFNRYAGRSESLLSRALRWPGLMVQHLTVFEPDDSMIEVAITAMKAVIPDDGSDEW